MPRKDLADFPELGTSVAETLLTCRFRWYSQQATATRRAHLGLGLAQLAAALVIAVSIAFSAPRWLAPALGALIAFLEGVRSLFRVQDSYLSYRAAAEQLRNEAWLFAQGVGDYSDSANPQERLAERIVQISTQENEVWVSTLRGSRRAAGAGS